MEQKQIFLLLLMKFQVSSPELWIHIKNTMAKRAVREREGILSLNPVLNGKKLHGPCTPIKGKTVYNVKESSVL